jgi:fructose-bisphosphate aldolase class 1
MTTEELNDTARTLVADGKGFLAMDVFLRTCNSAAGNRNLARRRGERA